MQLCFYHYVDMKDVTASHYNNVVMNELATGQCDHNIYSNHVSISRLMFMIMSHDLGGHLKLHGSEQVTELQLVIA